MGFYKYVLREEAQIYPEGRIVGVRWVKVDKGTREKPKVRCRFVAQGFARKGYRDDLFAGTPPLAAAKLTLSELASKGK